MSRASEKRKHSDWESFRREMPCAEEWAYFDHAAVAPLAGPALKAMRECCEDACSNGDVNWHRWRKKVEEARQLGAKMLGATTEEVALVRNTTEGIHYVAEGFPWNAGDNVVVPAAEFPSNLLPWQNLGRLGVEVRLVRNDDERLELKDIDKACDSRTRIVAASWVGYATGWRNDIDGLCEIAHRHGALFCLDAIQGMGVLSLDVGRTPIDFAAADGHKWMLGPEGAGLFYIRHKHLELLQPLGVGWNSVGNAGDFSNRPQSLKTSAARYEGGTYNTAGFAGLAASLELLLRQDIKQNADRIFQVTDELCEKLLSAGAKLGSDRREDRRSGIVACNIPGWTPEQFKKACLKENVVVNCRAGRVRISPHVYTTSDDIDRLIAVIPRN